MGRRMFGTGCKGCSSDASAAAVAAADARDCRGTWCNCLIIIQTDDAEHVRAAHITACCTMLQPSDAEPCAPWVPASGGCALPAQKSREVSRSELEIILTGEKMTCMMYGGSGTHRVWIEKSQEWKVTVYSPGFSCGAGRTSERRARSQTTRYEKPSAEHPAPTKKTALSF